jgi:hypothetical protein
MAIIQSTKVSDRSLPFAPVHPGEGVVVYRSAELETVGADLESTATVYEMIPIYEGETVVNMWLQADDLDTGIAALVLDVGDGVVTDRYMDGSTAGQAGGSDSMIIAAGAAPSAVEFPFVYTDNDTIDIAVQVAAATGAIGTLRLVALIAQTQAPQARRQAGQGARTQG